MSRPTTSVERTPAPPVLPQRFASGTVPPPVAERPLPSLFAVVAQVRAHGTRSLPTPARPALDDPDDVETIVVDLDDDEILLTESDLSSMLID
ncbi:MAG TPA: hypothetical protein VMZ28_28965 [Kofleriaceae bacterium]|nr:hypothetical protein [Kofleriaceae bacterium]